MGDRVGMRSRRLGEWEDVTDYDKFGESSIVLRNTYGEDSLRDLAEILENEQSSIKNLLHIGKKPVNGLVQILMSPCQELQMQSLG